MTVQSKSKLIHPGRNLSKAEVFRVGCGDQMVAIKTYRNRPWWLRHTLGRYLIAREARIYQSLKGVAGTVEFLGRTDAYSIELRFVHGVTLGSLRGKQLPDTLLEQLIETIHSIHQRGVVLMDLHDWDVLVNLEAEQLWVVDFGAASRHAAVLTQLDEILIGKMRQRFWQGAPPDPSGLVGFLWRGHHALSSAWRRLRRFLRHSLHGEPMP